MERSVVAWARNAVIVFAGTVNAGFGAYSLIAPAYLAELAGIDQPGPAVLTELRAVYGGLVGTLGLLVIRSVASRDSSRSPRLLDQRLLGVIFAGLALGRGVGTIIDGSPPFTLGALAFEAGTAVALLWRPSETRSRSVNSSA